MPTFFHASGFDVEDFDEEIVLVNFETGVYYTIKGSGPTVFRALQTGLETDALYESVRVAGGSARLDEVREFISQLYEEGIVVDTDTPVESTATLDGSALSEAPVIEKFDDVSDLIKLDPIHDVSDLGWPHKK